MFIKVKFTNNVRKFLEYVFLFDRCRIQVYFFIYQSTEPLIGKFNWYEVWGKYLG